MKEESVVTNVFLNGALTKEAYTRAGGELIATAERDRVFSCGVSIDK